MYIKCTLINKIKFIQTSNSKKISHLSRNLKSRACYVNLQVGTVVFNQVYQEIWKKARKRPHDNSVES